jgi:hypothetical protein
MPTGDQPSPALPWLSRATLVAARAARSQPGALARTGDGGSEAVREVILAHHPALPLTMIAEAVAYILGAD